MAIDGSDLYWNYLKPQEEDEGLVQDVFLKKWETGKSKKRFLFKILPLFLLLHQHLKNFRVKQLQVKLKEEIGLT